MATITASILGAPADPISLVRLQAFLRNGRTDYEWVAGRIYASCLNDSYVLQKILGAVPEDAPSPGPAYGSDGFEEEDDDDDDDNDKEESGVEVVDLADPGTESQPIVLADDGNGRRYYRKGRKQCSSQT